MNSYKTLYFWTYICLALVLSSLLASGARRSDGHAKATIQTVLDAQIVAWNHGDLNGFMAGYEQSPDLVYVGNSKVVKGYPAVLDAFRQRFTTSGEQEMGVLHLVDEEITMIGKDAALVWGQYVVTTSDGKKRGGPYTLVMRKLPEGWRAVYDRTSSQPQ